MNEIDSLLRVDAGGVILYIDSNALPAQLDEWLRTPEGSVWGWPSWGNPLRRFSHEPMNDNTAVLVENFLIDKLKKDSLSISLMGIRCNPVTADMYRIVFYHQSGQYEVYIQTESKT